MEAVQFSFWKIEYSRRPGRARLPIGCGSLIREERLREFRRSGLGSDAEAGGMS
jgi:hypothetical protein